MPGKLGDFLIMAGGCNFPDRSRSLGRGSHVITKGIYVCSGERFFRIALGEGWKSPVGGSHGATVSPCRIGSFFHWGKQFFRSAFFRTFHFRLIA